MNIAVVVCVLFQEIQQMRHEKSKLTNKNKNYKIKQFKYSIVVCVLHLVIVCICHSKPKIIWIWCVSLDLTKLRFLIQMPFSSGRIQCSVVITWIFFCLFVCLVHFGSKCNLKCISKVLKEALSLSVNLISVNFVVFNSTNSIGCLWI